MVFLLYTSSILLIMGGALLLLAPKLIIRISESPLFTKVTKNKDTDEPVDTLFSADETILLWRYYIAPVLILLGVYIIYVALSQVI